jgi:hypothetical protein
MGRTIPSYRIALEDEISSWRGFAQALRAQDRGVFERLVDASRNYATEAGNATRPEVFEAMVMSMLLFQQKKLDKLEKELNSFKSEETQLQYPVMLLAEKDKKHVDDTSATEMLVRLSIGHHCYPR